jgi:hypothetical protein
MAGTVHAYGSGPSSRTRPQTGAFLCYECCGPGMTITVYAGLRIPVLIKCNVCGGTGRVGGGSFYVGPAPFATSS